MNIAHITSDHSPGNCLDAALTTSPRWTKTYSGRVIEIPRET